MRLLRLELSGFKSFCDKGVLTFAQNGISIVVGPNGCGKSNIVDAIRWTLGEQSAKHLRGSSMEDVIFNGSANRKPVSMAQVSLVFSNEEHDTLHKYAEFAEITVTRRLYRSGESLYMINNTPSRLMDIRELFMDTGIGGKAYSIIEQGRIGQIIASRPEERRLIIDEAAGIVKYKAKRQEAEKKLEQTKQNLSRVQDILNELIKQEVVLKVQVEKAEVYQETQAKIEHLHKCLEAYKWSNLKVKFDKLTSSRDQQKEAQKDLSNKMSALEANEEKIKLDIVQQENMVNECRKMVQNQKDFISEAETKLQLENQALTNLEQWKSKGEREVLLLDEKLKSLNQELERESTTLTRLEEELEIKKDTLEELDEIKKIKERQLRDHLDEQEGSRKLQIQVISKVTGLQNQLGQSKERLQDVEDRKKRLEEQIAEHKDQKTELYHRLRESKTLLEEKQEQRKLLKEKVRDHEFEYEEQEKKLKELQKDLEKKGQHLTQIRSRFQSLDELDKGLEEFDSSTRVFLDYLQEKPDIAKNLGYLGTLQELVQLSDSPPQQILSFLDEYFSLLIFQSVDTFPEVAPLLRKLDIGQIQLFFLDLLDDSPTTSNGQELNLWIEIQNNLGVQERKLLPFSRVIQVIEEPLESLNPEVLRQPFSLIDPVAGLMTREKIFILGKRSEKSKSDLFIKRKKEMEELQEQISVLELEMNEEKENYNLETEIIAEMKRTITTWNKDLMELSLEIVGKEKEQTALQQEIDRVERFSSNIQEDQKKLEESRQQFQQKIVECETSLEESYQKQDELEEKMESLTAKIEDAKMEMSDEQEEFHRLKIVVTGLEGDRKGLRDKLDRLSKEQDICMEQLDKVQKERTEYSEKSSTLKTSLEALQGNLPALVLILEERDAVLKEQIDKLEEQKNHLIEAEKQNKSEKSKLESAKEENHNLEVKMAQLGQEAANIEQNLFAAYKVKPEEALQLFSVEEFDQTKENNRMRNLKQKLGGMDGINLGAKEEYVQIKERLDFLSIQSNDLTRSVEALEESIAKINLETRKRFRDTYHQINTQFQDLFPRLFGGGEARLMLTDENDLLNTGVDIFAQPPGKRLQNITLLSGGEKAMTAISLIFAVFLIKPSPFCLLDEVDAPLDDANVGRFNQIVKKMTENSQFIIITHNKKTMEIGDSLFGITMEEPGASKVVSVNFLDKDHLAMLDEATA